VPGRITALESRGANRLIQDGAAVAMGWEDVVGLLPERWKACLREAPAAATQATETLPDLLEARQVLSLLSDDPVDIDIVIERSGLGAGRVSAALLDLELEGRVRQIEGKRFVRVGRG
jgi:DNA processing protein